MATRWGCVGPGKISWDFFLAIKENLPHSEHQFVSVASKDLARAQKFAAKFDFQNAYGSYDELAKDNNVDVVYIGTIHASHAELSIQMLKAGKHVLCEKPMGVTYDEVSKVLEVAKEQKRLFIEAVWSRWFPLYEQVRKEISSGAVGDPRLVYASFVKPIMNSERCRNPGGGGLLDIGIYVVQFACMVFQEMPESITVVGNMRGVVDESASIVLKYKNGAMATLTYHTDAGYGNCAASVMGEKGRIEVASPFHCPTQITTPTGTFTFPLKSGDYYHENSAGLQFEAAAVREYLKNGVLEGPNYTHAESRLVHRIMEEIRRQLNR